MELTKKEIAVLFSNGKFENILNRISHDCVWEIYGEKKLSGKEMIIQNCKEVGEYFNSV